MRILVTNDDGITAPGIIRLAELARRFADEVFVIAPESQCSAMSQKLTIMSSIEYEPAEFPVPGVKAWCVAGTPADCVKVGLYCILEEYPDYVFSGINAGYNSGFDIAYSGTVGAAMEARMAGIPALAFSTDFIGEYGTTDKYIYEVTKDVMARPLRADEIWNINFPGIPAEDCAGILYDRTIAGCDFYNNGYSLEWEKNGRKHFKISPVKTAIAEPGTDIEALLKRYISIGTIKSMVLNMTINSQS